MQWLLYFLVGVVHFLFVSATQIRVPKHLRRYAEGPNMCVVQKARDSNSHWFTSCFGGKRLRMICERPTYMDVQCCAGYHEVKGTRGCTGVRPVRDIVSTAHRLGQLEFVKYVRQAGLADQLATGGAYTVFVPNNMAFLRATKEEKANLVPTRPGVESELLYHVAPGRINMTELRRGQRTYNTLYKDDKIMVNKYAFGVITVNCARAERTDELATNGIVHVIDGIVKPLEAEGTLAEKIFNDDDFSQFQLALFVSDIANELRREDVTYTVLAPTNKAFAKLPSDLLDAILTDADTAAKVVKNHIVEGVYCKDAVVIAMGLKTNSDERIMMRCKRDGVYFGGAKVVEGDIQAKNGILHKVDKVITPRSVKELSEVARNLKLNTLMDLAETTRTDGRLHGKEEITLLAPTDAAFKKLPTQYLAALRTDPLRMEKLMDYHTMKGKITTDKLVGDQDINTNLGISAKIKVNIFRGGVAVNNAKIVDSNRVCGNGVLHQIDTVLVPPENTLMEQVTLDPELSTLRQAIETAGLSSLLSGGGQMTLLAPTNKAFETMYWRNLEKLLGNPQRLKKFLERHIINRMVVKCSVPAGSQYTIKSRQGDRTHFTVDYRDRLVLNKKVKVERADNMAKNGLLYKIDDVLKCTCEPRVR